MCVCAGVRWAVRTSGASPYSRMQMLRASLMASCATSTGLHLVQMRPMWLGLDGSCSAMCWPARGGGRPQSTSWAEGAESGSRAHSMEGETERRLGMVPGIHQMPWSVLYTSGAPGPLKAAGFSLPLSHPVLSPMRMRMPMRLR